MAGAYSRGKKSPRPGVHEDVRVLAATFLAFLVLAAPAGAADHLMTVDEVATSMGASPANQFVELLDPSNEPFLFPTGYRLSVYDGAGVSAGSQSLGSGMAIVDGGTPMLVGKGTIGATPDVTLTVALPTSAGQACFERGDGSIVHCLRWGTIANPVGSLAASGPAPSDGESLQICSGQAALGNPTPKAANLCGVTGPGVTAPPDTRRPAVSLQVSRQTVAAARRNGLKVRVRSDEFGRARARLQRRGRTVRTVTATLLANRTRTLTLRLPRGTSARTFRVQLTVTDLARNARTVSRLVTLAR
jgi:hypothetical protein